MPDTLTPDETASTASSSMTILRRVSALVMSLLVLQLTLAAGGGYACEDPDPAPGNSHAGMVMGGESAAVVHAPADAPPCDASSDGSCGLPAGRGACRAMAPCAAMMLVESAHARSSLVHAPVPVTRELAPSTTSRTPELPPPRV
jgi:hypothetical protein